MFKKYHKLKEIKGLNNFNENKTANKIGMFFECKELNRQTEFNSSNNNNPQDIIKQLNEENKKLKNEMQNMLENMFAISFISTNQTINYLMVCRNSDNFEDIEEKLFNEYPQLKNKNIYFMANGNVINRCETLEKNGIKNSTVILIIEND